MHIEEGMLILDPNLSARVIQIRDYISLQPTSLIDALIFAEERKED